MYVCYGKTNRYLALPLSLIKPFIASIHHLTEFDRETERECVWTLNKQMCTIFSVSAALCDLIACLLAAIQSEREHWRFLCLCVCFLQWITVSVHGAMELDFLCCLFQNAEYWVLLSVYENMQQLSTLHTISIEFVRCCCCCCCCFGCRYLVLASCVWALCASAGWLTCYAYGMRNTMFSVIY